MTYAGTGGRFRVAFPRHWWYPACQSSDLSGRPIGTSLMSGPVVLFRDGAGQARALVDRCPHRNLPLSLGRVHRDGCLECAYHGWRFDGGGNCAAVPGLGEDLQPSPGRNVTAHDTRERDGFVWLWGQSGVAGVGDPFALPDMTGPGTGQVVFPCDLDCTMHAAIENSLDVPHTAFLHRGLFRGGNPRPMTAVRRAVLGGAEVEYVGEPFAFGRLRAPRADLTFDHWDRFFLPSIAQVEYRVKGWLRIVNTILHLPMSSFSTRAWFVVRYWTRLPAPLVRPVVSIRGEQILRQDALVLAQQSAYTRRFDGERYASTDLDLIGNTVWRLLREAERSETSQTGEDDDLTVDDEEAAGSSVTFRL